MKAELVLGLVNENYVGGKMAIAGGFVGETFAGIKMSTHHGLVIENKNKGVFGKNEMSITEAKSAAMHKAKLFYNKAKLILQG